MTCTLLYIPAEKHARTGIRTQDHEINCGGGEGVVKRMGQKKYLTQQL